LSAKRIFVAAITTLLLTATAATADPGGGNLTGKGPGFCGGPPGQSGLVQFAKEPPPLGLGEPPGQVVSHCNLHGHQGVPGS
jgi:hypothetical protein